jgi:ParB/RepB/Spo0J family partition protein
MQQESQGLANEDGYGRYALIKIRKSPDNRKRFNEQALQELAASIKAMGVAQPILIRPVTPTAEQPEEYEIVAGERRYRASIIAGMETIPAVCRVLSDLDAAKIRILENLQREDPHPIEEAEGYQQLMLQHGYSADQLAEEVKKSRAYIYGRLKLCALTTEVREQFLNDKIPASTALLIARIPVPDLQARALKEILSPSGWPPEPMSYRRAAEHVQSRYMLDLATAVFKLEDGKLLASAGACVKCPKRTGNQPELFPGLSADVCTDPDCFAEKRAAHHAATLVLANKKGIPVYEGEEAQQKLRMRWYADGELVGEETSIQLFARNAPSTKNAGVAKTYLKDTMPVPTAYVKQSDGSLVAVYDRNVMQAALEAAGACETAEVHAARMSELAANPSKQPGKTPAQLQNETHQEAARKREQTATDETTFRVEVYKRLRQRAASGFSLHSLRELTKLALSNLPLPSDLLSDIYDFDSKSDATVCAYIDDADLAEVQLLLIDLLVGETLSITQWDVARNGYLDDDFQTVAAMAKHEGVDPGKIREELFPTPIDVTDMQYDDLVKCIQAYPARIDELTEIVLGYGPRVDLVDLLEKAANSLGYFYGTDGFALRASPAALAEAAEPVVDAADIGTASTAAVIDAVDEQPEVWTDFDPAPPAAAASPAKKPGKKAKAAAKRTPPKAENKPDAAAPGKKAVKPSKPAPAPAKVLKPADAWPFPKSSTGTREAAPAAAEQPPAAEVPA